MKIESRPELISVAPQLTILLPCKNEAENIPLIYNRIKKAMGDYQDYEMLYVEYASIDDSRKILGALAKKDKKVRWVEQVGKPGMARGWWFGYKAARGKYVLITDCDMQYAPEDIPKLYKEMLSGKADLVQGYRQDINFPIIRFALSMGMNCLFKVLFLIPLKDVKSGFFICKKTVLGDILKYNDDYYYFQQYFTMVAKRKGYSFAQVPVVFGDREHGQSYIGNSFPLKFIVKSTRDIMHFFIDYFFKRKFDN